MSKRIRAERYRVRAGEDLEISRMDPSDTSGFEGSEADALAETAKLLARMDELQETLFAEHSRGMLVVLQAMDTGGKDGTIRKVFSGVNPAGVRVAHFREPSEEELDHDFLWRVHHQTPGKGELVIFNRSHYESVLVERVHNLVPESVWRERYRLIVDFERTLAQSGTALVKFFLNISFEEQRRRLMDRLKNPSKRWKLSPTDEAERRLWPDYMKAYQHALKKTSRSWSPWYVVPSDHKWYRDLVVASVMVDTLESMKLRYPKPSFDLESLKIR